MKVIVYHNPRCSKSRETIKLLEAQNIDFEVRLYLQDIPQTDEIRTLLSLLGFSSARELMRCKEKLYQELNLADENNEEVLIQALCKHPQLIERPIVIINSAAKICRPPELVLSMVKH